jgi:predicted dehydrogenase
MSIPKKNDPARRPSRRDFLKTSGAAVGAAALGSLAIGRSAHAAGDDVLKVGLIGCGGRGTGAAVNAMNADKNAKIVALADAFEDRVKGSLANLKKQRPEQVAVSDDHVFVGFDAYEKLLASGVDVVLLCETPHFRPRHLKAAIDAGKHVFCEKPVAVDGPGYRSILATTEEAKKKNLCIVSGLCWRYDPAVQETMKRVLDGAIGDILAIQETYLTGGLWFREKTEKQSEIEYQMRNWYNFHWLSGDHNVEQHVHSLDKGSWAMGDKPPVRAWGLGGRQARDHSPQYGNIFDHHAVVYEYASGARMYSYCRQQKGCYGDVADHFFGTKGTCCVLPKYTIKGATEWKFSGQGGSMYDLEHVALFKAIRSGTPINNGQYMAVSTMLAVLGRMVNYTGQVITWDQAINSQEALVPSEYSFNGVPPVVPGADGKYTIAVPGTTEFK